MFTEFTEYGLQMIEESKQYGLDKWYEPHNGNFMFTESEFNQNFEQIKAWLKNHTNYALEFYKAEEYWFMYDVTEC